MGVVKPTDAEKEEMMAEMQGQPEDPNSIFLQAAAEEAQAKAAKARADTVLTIAKAEETQAKTMETLVGVQQETGGEVSAPAAPAAPVVDQFDLANKELELENKRIDIAIKMAKLQQSADESARLQQATQTDVETQNVIVDARETIKEAVEGMKDSIGGFQKAIEVLAEINKQNAESAAKVTEQALDALKKPKRVVREKGRIVGIE
jgi:hypothetical protein